MRSRPGSSMPPAWWSCPAASTCTATSSAPRSTRRGRCARSSAARPSRSPRTPARAAARWAIVPSTFVTGYKYAGLGYTTAFDAAIAPLAARHAHEEFADTPCIDKGFFALMGNNHYIMRAIQRREPEKLKAFVGWLLHAAKGYAAKLVNPGGVEIWKHRQAGNVKDLDSRGRPLRRHASPDHRGGRPGGRRAATPAPRAHPHHQPGPPRQLDDDARDDEAPRRAPRASDPHPVPQLRRRRRRTRRPSARRSAPLAEYVNDHPNLTVDVGQVVFGQTMSMTADGPVGYYLSRLYRIEVVQHRHRAGGGLRHRADRVQEHEPGPRLAVGDRAGVVPAGQRSRGGSR